MTKRIELIADLLMGAAYADDNLDGREVEVVKELLAKVMHADVITDEVEAKLKDFDPKSFDPVAAAQSIGFKDDKQKRYLIELIAAVTEADEELDLDENVYIETVAKAMGLPRETFTDLTFEVLSVENLRTAGRELVKPPPVPEAAKKK